MTLRAVQKYLLIIFGPSHLSYPLKIFEWIFAARICSPGPSKNSAPLICDRVIVLLTSPCDQLWSYGILPPPPSRLKILEQPIILHNMTILNMSDINTKKSDTKVSTILYTYRVFFKDCLFSLAYLKCLISFLSWLIGVKYLCM